MTKLHGGSRPETITSADILRHFIGLDPLERLQANLGNYPPHNIEQITEERFVLTLAVAGFKENHIDISLGNGFLTIIGKKDHDMVARKFVHQGIASRDFIREFKLGDNVEVSSASLEDGLLVITLDRIIPQDEQVRRIPISSSKS